MANKKIVVLAGAGGNLGYKIASHLLSDPHVQLHCLVSRESEKTNLLKQKGATLFITDYSSPARLKEAFDGAFSVVSALQGGKEVIIDRQLELYKAAAGAGASRFIPSDFSFDFFNLPYGDNWFLDLRKQFAHTASGLGLATPLIHVLNGCFMDESVLFGFLGAFDLKNATATYWGDGKTPMDLTTYEDTAKFTAAACTTDMVLPTKLYIAGDCKNFHQIVSLLETERGTKVTVTTKGSLQDLDREIGKRIKENPENVFAFIPLMYYRAMLSGKGKLGSLSNSLFAHIQPTSLASYLNQM